MLRCPRPTSFLAMAMFRLPTSPGSFFCEGLRERRRHPHLFNAPFSVGDGGNGHLAQVNVPDALQQWAVY